MAVGQVFSNNAIQISESSLCFREANAVLGLIDKILLRIPVKAFHAYAETLAYFWLYVHIFIWHILWLPVALASNL